MSLQTARIPTSVGVKLAQGSGRRTVIYRAANGQRYDAVVMGPGSSSGAKLAVRTRNRSTLIDNVPKATTLVQTNVYMTRLP